MQKRLSYENLLFYVPTRSYLISYVYTVSDSSICWCYIENCIRVSSGSLNLPVRLSEPIHFPAG